MSEFNQHSARPASPDDVRLTILLTRPVRHKASSPGRNRREKQFISDIRTIELESRAGMVRSVLGNCKFWEICGISPNRRFLFSRFTFFPPLFSGTSLFGCFFQFFIHGSVPPRLFFNSYFYSTILLLIYFSFVFSDALCLKLERYFLVCFLYFCWRFSCSVRRVKATLSNGEQFDSHLISD